MGAPAKNSGNSWCDSGSAVEGVTVGQRRRLSWCGGWPSGEEEGQLGEGQLTEGQLVDGFLGRWRGNRQRSSSAQRSSTQVSNAQLSSAQRSCGQSELHSPQH